MKLRRNLGIVLIISAVVLVSLLHSISHQQNERTYGETTTVVRKNSRGVKRWHFIPVSTPIGVVWRRSSNPGFFWVYRITTSSAKEYEVILKKDWDIIRAGDVLKQFTGLPYDVERGSGIYYECTYAPVKGMLCWLELWRNGTHLKDIKAYKPPG